LTSVYFDGIYVTRCDNNTGGSTRETIAMWGLGLSLTEKREVGTSFKI